MTMTLLKSHFLAQTQDGAAFESKAFSVARRVVAGCATETEHRVLFLGFEVGAADQVRVFVGLEVAHAHDHRIGMKGGGDRARPRASRSTKYSVLSA